MAKAPPMDPQKLAMAKNQVSIGGLVDVDKGTAETVAGTLDTLSDFSPSMALGSLGKVASGVISKGAIHRGLVNTWQPAMAKTLGVDPSKLEGEEGLELVAQNIHLMPKEIQEEWHNAEDLANRTTKFIGDFAFQGGLIYALGGIPGMAASFMLSKPENYVLDQALNLHEKLSVSMVIPQISELARQRMAQLENPDVKSTQIDKSLVGAYLISAYSERFKDTDGTELNNEEFVNMFHEHMASKQENPLAVTRLDDFMKRLDRDGAFASFVPPDADLTKLQGTTYLDVVANHIQGEQDLSNLLFEPESFAQKLKVHSQSMDRMQGAISGEMIAKATNAGKGLYNQVKDIQGLPPRIPVKGKSRDQSSNYDIVT